jgi:Peptidase family M28
MNKSKTYLRACICMFLLSLALLGFNCDEKASKDTTAIDDQFPDTSTESAAGRLPFNGENAYDFVADQLSFGPRVPGSEAAASCAVYLHDILANNGWQARVDSFEDEEFPGITFRNVIGTLGSGTPRLLLLAHYDSKPAADHDPDPTVRDQPIPGANDGASGVGLLLELSRILGKKPATFAIGILFTDGEDYAFGNGAPLVGAKRYASSMTEDEVEKTSALILLDMVGDENGLYPYERNSNRTLYDIVAIRAREAGLTAISGTNGAITDDHLPFVALGIPSVDIIQYPFPDYWHTLADDISTISAVRLEQVGNTMLKTIEYFEQQGFGALNR